MPERLSVMDGSFLRVETANAHMHVAWSAVFKLAPGRPRPSLARLRRHIAGRLEHVPRFRRRLGYPLPGMGWPAAPRPSTSGSCARRWTMARTAGCRTSARGRRLMPRLTTAPPTARSTTATRVTSTAPSSASSAARPPVARHQRSGWTGAARCAVNVWGGEPTTVCGYDGLRSGVKQALGDGMSRRSRFGTDIGGTTPLARPSGSRRELLLRWIQFGSVSAVMRTKRSGLAFPSYDAPAGVRPESCR